MYLSSNISFTWESITELLVIFLALFYMFQLISFRNFKTKSNRLLALIFCFFALIQSFYLFQDIGLKDLATNMLFIFTPMVLAIAPTIFLYTKSLVNSRGVRLTFKKDLRHYFLSGIYLIIGPVSLSLVLLLDKGLWLRQAAGEILSWSTMIALAGIYTLQNVFYIYHSYRLYYRHKRKIGQIFSYGQGINLKWMRLFILGYIFFVVGLYVISIVNLESDMIIFNVLLFAYLGYVGYNGSRQVDIYIGIMEEEAKDKNAEESLSDKEELIPKEGFSIQEGKVNEIKEGLTQLMAAEKPFLNVKLTIYDIAKSLNVSAKYISHVINSEFKQNFISYINHFRIEEAKSLLLDPEHKNITIEAIAQLSGFKSKSAFNAAFKKITGTTPSGFKN